MLEPWEYKKESSSLLIHKRSMSSPVPWEVYKNVVENMHTDLGRLRNKYMVVHLEKWANNFKR